MYYKYYGLREKPFSLAADPKFLYYSLSHKEAFAQMMYTASQDSGFMVLTGEVGTGKTIMINALIDRLPRQYRVAKIYHTALNPEGLVQSICKEFGLDFLNSPLSHLILKIQDFLKWTHHSGEHSILILDEAQNLNAETLEEIRMLSNFESAHKKILQIILVGQPELEEKMWEKNLRQLRERVSLRYRLRKLSLDDTIRYIQHRLTVAGRMNGRIIFTNPAMRRVHALSDGVPRRINILCDNAMLMGYAENYKHIDEDTVRKVGYYNQKEESIPEFVEHDFTPPPIRIKEKKVAIPEGHAAFQASRTTAAVASASTARLEKRIKELQQHYNGNGSFDYKKFHSFMQQYLETNHLAITKKSNFGKTFTKVFFGFTLLVLSFLTAIYIAIHFNIIKY